MTLHDAKHTNPGFFEELFYTVKSHLTKNGVFWVILPPETFQQIKNLINISGWQIAHITHVFLENGKPEFRSVICLSQHESEISHRQFYLRNTDQTYHPDYISALKNFLTIF